MQAIAAPDAGPEMVVLGARPMCKKLVKYVAYPDMLGCTMPKVATVSNHEIALVRLPGERARLEKLRSTGTPRLILVESDAEPPISTDLREDWIRVPADERDVIARQEGLRRRLESPKDEVPELDEAGLLRFEGNWVSIPPMEVSLLSELVDNLGSVVARETLADATWPDGSKGRNALDVHMLRLRRRVAQVGLVIRTVRARGYLLEVPDQRQSDAG